MLHMVKLSVDSERMCEEQDYLRGDFYDLIRWQGIESFLVCMLSGNSAVAKAAGIGD